MWGVSSLRVGDEGEDHAVEVVEEADEIEAELDEALLFVCREGAEDLCGVERMVFVHDLVDVECDERSVEQKGDPLPTEQEEERQRGVRRHLGQNELLSANPADRRREKGEERCQSAERSGDADVVGGWR